MLEILKAAVNFISVLNDMDEGMVDLRSSQEEIVVARESLMASQAKLAIAQDKLESARTRLAELTKESS